jgi:hypothetical protein
VDAVTGDRGQALVVAVLAVAIGAVTIVGLRAAQDRIFTDARERRAGEAAVEAAGAEVADAFLVFARSFRDDGGGELRLTTGGIPSDADVAAFVRDPALAQRARSAAMELAAANGAPPIDDLAIRASDRAIEISLRLDAHRHRSAIDVSCCLR